MRSKNATKNIITGIIMQICIMICGFILPRIIITTYGSETNGLVSSITQFLSFISLLDGGIGIVIKAALYKPIAQHDDSRIEQILKSSQKFLNHILYIFGVYVLALCIFYPILMKGDDSFVETSTLIIAISLSSVAEYSLCFVYRIYLDANQKTYIVSILQTITTIVSTVVSVILIKIGANISIVKLSASLVYFLRAIIQSMYVKHHYHINLKKKQETYQLPGRWDGLLQHIATVIHDNADVVILTIFSTTTLISVYSVYALVTTGLRNLIKSFSSGMDSIFGDMLAKKERLNLNKKMQIYEFIYFTVLAISFSCALVLITPFISVYTQGVTDATYYQPLFGYIVVLAQAFWAIRQPYDAIVFAAGEFKSTRNGAIVEAAVNIIISVSLIWKFGLIGVAVGTLVAMIIRTTIYIRFASKKVLGRANRIVISHIIVALLEMTGIYFIATIIITDVNFNSYGIWLKYALQILGISACSISFINCIIYHADLLSTIKMLRQIFTHKNINK